MFEQISMMSRIFMILSPDECNTKWSVARLLLNKNMMVLAHFASKAASRLLGGLGALWVLLGGPGCLLGCL